MRLASEYTGHKKGKTHVSKTITLILSTASGEFGGTERTACELARTLRANGHSPVLVCVGQRVDQIESLVGDVPVEVLAGAEFGDISVREWRELLARHGAEVVVRSKNCVGLISWRLDLAVRLAGCRYVSWEQHTAKPAGIDPSMPLRKGLIGRGKQQLRLAAHFAAPHHTIAVSMAVREALVQHYGRRPGNIEVVYPGVDFSQLSQSEEGRRRLRIQWDVKDSTLVVGSFGRLAIHKGNDLLLRAFSRILTKKPSADIRCVIGGVGGDMERLVRMVRDLGLNDRVVFAGWQEERQEFLSALDLLVLPSSDEGLGLVLIEAIACGALALSREIGGMPEVFGNLSSRFVVESANPEAWAESICVLLDSDREARSAAWTALNDAVRRQFDGRHQWAVMAAKVIG